MFSSCKLHLSQSTGGGGQKKWVEVVLFYPRNPQIQEGQSGEDFASEMILFPWRGRWRLDVNSVTNQIETAYTVGTSAPPAQKFWRWTTREGGILEFVESSRQVGGGLPFGASTQEDEIAVELHGARLTRRGIEPYAASGEGRGVVHLGSNILRPGYPIRWEWMI